MINGPIILKIRSFDFFIFLCLFREELKGNIIFCFIKNEFEQVYE